MGLFDSFLNAVESGALEERLNKVADTIENASKRAGKALDQTADKPGTALQKVTSKKTALEAKARAVTDTVSKKD
jgi:division protein CdvB (Snf7/Vps24/ESCRT-III family)